MLLARNGYTSTPSLVRAPGARQRWLHEYATRKYKLPTTLGADIGRYGERTVGERDNETFGTCRIGTLSGRGIERQ